MTSNEARPPKHLGPVRGARRIAIVVIIASLFLAAVIGIIAVLSGNWGDLQAKVLLTTLVLAAFSITSLCHLAVVDRAVKLIGFVGIGASAGAFIAAMVLIWRDWADGADMNLLVKWLGVLSVIAVSLAHANLLLPLATRRRRPIRAGLWATLAMITAVAILIIIPIVTDGKVPGDNGDAYWRFFAVVAILDVLGTIVVPISSIFLKDGTPISDATVRVILDLPVELVTALDVRAKSLDLTREAAAIDAIERAVANQRD